MHPDKKVGLALGILLIGITGAFFFRNDAPAPDEGTMTLSDPESLDRKVSQKPGAPYFPENEVRVDDEQLDLSDVPEARAADVIPDVPQLGSSGYRGIFPAPVGDGDTGAAAEHFTDRRAPLPLPGQDLNGLDEVLSGREPGDRDGTPSATGAQPEGDSADADLSARPSDRGQPPGNRDAEVSKSGFITHEVVAGDNLSRLAKKYLGSHSKYLTLYEANRDLLASPDDLSPGMQLKIPQNRGEATGSSIRAPGESSTAVKKGSTGTVVGRLKKPAFERPDPAAVIALGGARPAGRKLSQTPPPNLPSVEGLNPDAAPAVIASRPK